MVYHIIEFTHVMRIDNAPVKYMFYILLLNLDLRHTTRSRYLEQ